MDFPNEHPDRSVSEVAEEQFREHYLQPLGEDVRYVRLESGFRVKPALHANHVLSQICIDKISTAKIFL